MSCEDICLSGNFDPSDNEFHYESYRKARVERKCSECNRAIQCGVRYLRVTGKTDSAIWSIVECVDCAEIQRAFYCDGWTYGSLWDDIFDQLFPNGFDTGCLTNLQSANAKAFMLSKWRDWKGL